MLDVRQEIGETRQDRNLAFLVIRHGSTVISCGLNIDETALHDQIDDDCGESRAGYNDREFDR